KCRNCLGAELLPPPKSSPVCLSGGAWVTPTPPWKFDRQLEELLPVLREHLAQGRFGEQRVRWLTGE
ncbi:MAG TPA: 23S rRNA (adenine(2030)-N(6))-methyltransferase RlmJ, partial [Rudaea sp.]|nr:23S rRNA (adenine(2030)-N(6))-methyltransferase RlmJ [Rudaea sp.]